MKIEITKVVGWKEVLNSARFTQRKELLNKTEPSEKFKKKVLIAEHSPLRCLMFIIDMYDIPYYAAMHFRTHKLVHAPFVSTSRPDIDGNQKPRNEQKKNEPVNMRLFLDAQEIIAISKVRLCSRAESETRNIWSIVIKELQKIEPELASVCVPQCIYRGFCPEFQSCGFVNTNSFNNRLKIYRNVSKGTN